MLTTDLSPGVDPSSLAELRRDMLKFARLQLRDEHLAEDAVQEAIAAALGGAKDFSGQATFKTWVFAILRNKIVDLLRHRRRSINVSALAPEDEGLEEAFDAMFKTNESWLAETRPQSWGNPEEALRQEQFWAVFEACLKRLPENTARVFMMREFLEFDTAEVCAELTLSVSNCNVILHRARNGLRMCLERNWFNDGAQAC